MKMTSNRAKRPETLLAQALGWVDETTGALVPPIHGSTTYQRDPDNQYRKGFTYTRGDNPTYAQVEALLADLEGGAAAMVLGSGMSAATLPFMSLKSGDHVVAQSIMYWGVRAWLAGFAEQWGLRVDLVEPSDIDGLAKMVRPGETKLVWIETPANPTFESVDIAAVAAIAHGAGARLCVDSTVATPILTRPIEHGADLVMHSATKYLNGHSDVLAGALIAARTDEWWDKLKEIRTFHGKVLGPMEAWLLLRGMRTLHLRVRQASENAMAIARRFAVHPKVTQVLYPGLESAPGHAIAARQMSGGFGGMLSMRFTDGEDAAIAVANRVKVFKRATSLGGVESLVEHRASIEGKGTPVPFDLLRFSVGVEHVDDLIADLEQAID
jgi:cystathionine gamma-synthase